MSDPAPGAGPQAPPRPGAIDRLRRIGPAVLAFVAVLALWEGATRLLDIETFILPKPSLIAERFVSNAGVIWPAGMRTLIEAVGGLVVGAAAAIVAALATVRWVIVREGLMPFAIAANSAPIIALAPIANAMFSLTSPVSKMAVVAVVVFFPIMINTARGLLEIDESEIELMRSYASTPREIMRRVRVPHALPFFFSALKVATTLSLIAAIVAEYFGGRQDVLGQYIVAKTQLFNFPDAWAAILVASLMGIGIYLLVVAAERLAMPWHVSMRTTEL